MDHGEVIAAFADALRGRGIIPDKIIGDSKPHRCDVEGGKRGKGDGAYQLWLDDMPAGWYQNHRDGMGVTYWHAKREQKLTAAQRRAYNTRCQQLRRAREQCEQQDYADAAIKALRIWNEATPALESHPYVSSKKITAHGVRQSREQLVVPVYGADHALQSLQFIYPDGKKRFLFGGKAKGGSFVIGEIKDRLCIAEGYATAASIHQATGLPVAVVFNADNIEPATRHLRKLASQLIFCADDDWKTDGNPGKTKAYEAAAKFDGLIAVPEFGPDREEKWTDFNDLANSAGAEAVARAIRGAQSTRTGSIAVAVEPQQAPPEPDIEPSAYSRRNSLGLELNANGQAITNVTNAAMVIEYDEHLKDIVWFDEFLHRMLTGNALLTEGKPREWCDADDIRLCIYMQGQLKMHKISVQTVSQAVIAHVKTHRRNCVRDWLLSLVWDGRPRLDQFFSKHFGAEGNIYTNAVSRNFWLSIVARILKPGCKVDNMVILEGQQGIGKSKALAAIGRDYFTEQHEAVTGRGFFEILQGKFLIEIGEMEAFNKSEVSKVKQVITCQSDRFREPYSKLAEDHPRQCVFVGTTNRTDWNRDETGARRFWPIACVGEIDVRGVERDREQLFAEAAKAILAGENWWTMPTIETEEEQRERYALDIWHERVQRFVAGKSVISTAEIVGLDCLGVPTERQDLKLSYRIGQIMRFLGWRAGTVRIHGMPKPVNRWKAPKKEPST